MALDRHILPAFGKMPLEEAGPGEVAAVHHRMRDAPSMANRAVWVLSRLYVLAEIWEVVSPGATRAGMFCTTARSRVSAF